MSEQQSAKGSKSARLVITGLVGVVAVLGLALVMAAIGSSVQGRTESVDRVDALANSKDECVECHRDETPGIVIQYGIAPWLRQR